MEKDLVIERLDNTIGMLKWLDPSAFDFTTWVSESQRDCGTVCCVAGWYPKFFPEVGLYWGRDTVDSLNLYPRIGNSIIGTLSVYHGLSEPLIAALFTNKLWRDPVSKFTVWYGKNDQLIELADCVNLFTKVRDAILNDDIQLAS